MNRKGKMRLGSHNSDREEHECDSVYSDLNLLIFGR